MNQYIQSIREAVLFFPVVALIITLPYLIYNYRRRGSVWSLRVLIIYSFILYLLCCFFLVIWPLPDRDYVVNLTTPTMQLTPFTFISEIVRDGQQVAGSAIEVVKSVLLSQSFYQVAFNLIMFIPFGIYLKYYFDCSFLKTLLLSFALSLLFELTQLSGLCFLYPRGYRLFDVDDLIINSLGGAAGYLLAMPLGKLLPTRQEIDEASYRRSQKVSLLRRTVALICDGVMIAILTVIIGIGTNMIGGRLAETPVWDMLLAVSVCYFAILPILNNSQTIGQKLTRLQVARVKGGPARWYQLIGRIAAIILVMVVLPIGLNTLIIYLLQADYITQDGAAVLMLAVVGAYLFLVFVEIIRIAIRKRLFYEKWTGTFIVSTTAIGRELQQSEATEVTGKKKGLCKDGEEKNKKREPDKKVDRAMINNEL